MAELTVKEFVTNSNMCHFDSFRNGIFYYNVPHVVSCDRYQFQVPIEDVTGVTLLSSDKAITFMRWIRKSIENGTLIKQ